MSQFVSSRSVSFGRVFRIEPCALEIAKEQLRAAGFEQILGREQIHQTLFREVGAVAYYLRTVPWQVPDFTVSKHLESLREIHRQIEASGPLKIRAHHFLVEAEKPRVK